MTQSGLRVTLLALNARYTHTNLALLYMRNAVHAAGCGHITSIRECVVTDRRADILEQLLDSGDVLVLSAYIWNSTLIRQLLPDIRAVLPSICIVLGGPEVSYTAEEWIQACPEINYLICGPGEAAMQQLAADGFQSPRRVITRPNPPFAEVPFPYTEDDLQRLSRRYIYYESSRGCPCSCSYCVSGRADQRPEFRDTETVKQELAQILAHEASWAGAPIVKFVDRSFNAAPDRARALWQHIATLDTNAVFHCEVQPAFLGEDDLHLLAGMPAGRLQFEIGIQSVVGETLKLVGRAAPAWEQMRERVERIIELGSIEVHLDMIVGLPGEELARIERTVDEVLALRPNRFDIGFLKSLPGTRIREEAVLNSQLAMQYPPYQVMANAWLSLQDFARMRRIEQLIDAVWNHNKLQTLLAAGEVRHGSAFAFFSALSAFAAECGYDVRTRNRNKVENFLQAYLCSE